MNEGYLNHKKPQPSSFKKEKKKKKKAPIVLPVKVTALTMCIAYALKYTEKKVQNLLSLTFM